MQSVFRDDLYPILIMLFVLAAKEQPHTDVLDTKREER